MLENTVFDTVEKATFVHGSDYHDPLVLQLPKNPQTAEIVTVT